MTLLVFALGVGTLALLAMIIRFVEPALVYGLRDRIVRIRARKAFLAKLTGRTVSDFASHLMKDYRFESSGGPANHPLQRVTQIRELYRLCDPNRKDLKEGKRPRPRVCIVELSSILASLGETTPALAGIQREVLDAGQLLRLLANHERDKDGLQPLVSERDVEAWFREELMPIEQIIEILAAVIFVLVYRQESRLAREIVGTPAFADYQTQLGIVERSLRTFVKRRLVEQLGSDDAALRRILEGVDDASVRRRIDPSLRDNPLTLFVVLEHLYFGELVDVIFRDWAVFRREFKDKKWLRTRIDVLLPVRNAVAHNREVPKRKTRALVEAYCGEILERIE